MVQIQMIDRTKQLAENDQNVSSVFMYGSFTKGEGDQYSDIEFYIFLKSKENFSAENWVSQIHPIELYFTNEYGSDVAIFENLIRGEFHFLEINQIEVIKTWDGLIEFSDFDKMILVDKEQILINTLNQIKTKKPDRTTNENIIWLSQSLLNVLLATNNLIKREEFAHAHQSLISVQKYLLWLIRIATSNTHHWESPTKSLEKDIEDFWYAEYRQTTASLNPMEIKLSFKKSIELSKRLFEKLKVDSKLNEILAKIQ